MNTTTERHVDCGMVTEYAGLIVAAIKPDGTDADRRKVADFLNGLCDELRGPIEEQVKQCQAMVKEVYARVEALEEP